MSSDYRERSTGWVTIEDVICVDETDLAIKVMIDERFYWIPQSMISSDSEVYADSTSGKLIIREVIAIEKGLV